jgi:DNA-binding beta-propeller fold protein YncE
MKEHLTAAVWTLAVLLCLVLGLVLGPARKAGAAPDPPTRSYYAYVCSESEDEVALVRYGPSGLEVVKTIVVGSFPAETEGPHGIGLDPDGKHWYVSLAHGFPFGSVHKYETDTDTWVGDVTLGMFPATLDVSAATGLLYVVNFDLHGPMEPSSISVVETDTMTEVERIPTGVMPHGSRLSSDGTWHYSVSMMNDEVVETDALAFRVNRTLALSPLTPTGQGGVQPTWVTPPTAGGRLYVAGNNVSQIFEVDLSSWSVVRTFDTGQGPYNLAVTPDELTLVATYKSGAAVGFWDLASGTERVRASTSRTIPHGVALTADGEYAFVTLEGVGSEPGTVEVYHVGSGERVGAVDVGKQAGGIAYWKTELP